MYNNFYGQIPVKYEVIHVNGENGARSLQMAPNSNALLLDDTAPIVWLAQTDGAGYKTVSAFDITPHVAEPEISLKDIMERLNVLEGKINESDNTTTKRRKAAEPATND